MNKIINYVFSALGDPLNFLNLCITSYFFSLQKMESEFDNNIDKLSDEQLKQYDSYRWLLASLRDLKSEYENQFENE